MNKCEKWTGEMNLRHERLVDPESRDSHRHGWTGCFEKLAELLSGRPGE
jgi:hypothetical protein